MKKEKKPYLVKIAEKISDDRDEQEIIQYGMHQGFLILCNILILMISGLFWGEVPFVIFVFWGIFFLRPYAGGYHADTELRCCFLFAVIINMVMFGKKLLVLSNRILIGLWVGMTVFIWIFAPVENPIHCLEENERKKYAKNTKRILLCYVFAMALGVFMKQRHLMEAIVWINILIGTGMAAGLRKYGGARR
jgi:accessory gene regulator B